VVHLPYQVDLCSPYERIREATHRELEDCIEAADCVGARKAILHARTDAWRLAYDDDELRRELVERILDLDSYAEHAGVELCVENLAGDFFRLDQEFPRLLDRGVSMAFDTGHAYVDGFDADDQARFLREHRESVSHVHLNDTRRDDEDEHLPLGAGTVDFDALLEPLRTDWSGTLALDVRTDDWDYVEESARRLTGLLEVDPDLDPDLEVP
jgi:sugar phosphate isomerase/epimerase